MKRQKGRMREEEKKDERRMLRGGVRGGECFNLFKKLAALTV